MRKFYAFLLIVLFLSASAMLRAQVSNYTFSQSNGTYVAITGGTVLGNTTSDDEQFVDPAAPLGSTTVFTGPGFPIGFNFTYNGIVFDRFAVENNGWISLGQSALTPSVDINTTSQYTPLSSTFAHTTAQFRNRIAGFGRDLQAQAGAELRFQTIGTAPNRKCVVQYTGYKRFGTAGTGDNITFQIILNETTNNVQVVFGNTVMGTGTTTSSINHVGLGGTAAADFNNRQSAVPHNWATTTAGATNAVGVQNPTSTIAVTMPATGLTFTWAAPAPCTGVPSPGLITGPSATICSGGPATLILSGYTIAPGITFQWNQSSTPGGPYTPIPGATNSTYTFNTVATAYFTCTVTCTASGLSANTTQFTVNVNRLVHSNVLATPNTGCAPVTTTITGTVSGGVTTGGSGIVASSGTINLAIPDNNPAGINTNLTVPSGTNFATASDLKIRITAAHSWSGDLIFRLTSPCGVTYLFDRLGVPVSTVGNSDNLGTNNTTTPPAAIYTFDLAGATVMPETTGGSGFIAAGTYKPSDVNGAAHNWAGITFPCNGAGTWTLNISDNAVLDVGSLVDWAIIGPGTGNYTHSLAGPGTIVQNPPSGANNSNASFTVSNLPAGTHNFTLTSTDVTGCSVSSPVTVTVNPLPAVSIIAGGSVTTVSYTGPAVAIPDNNTTGVNVTLPVSGITGNIIDVNFRFDAAATGTCDATVGNTNAAVDHTFIGDLIFKLTSPTATTATIVNRRGGTRENICNTLLDDDGGFPALSTITSVSGQTMNGNYAPDAPLSAFDGPSPNGNWVLNVSDNAGIDVGSLRRFSLVFTTSSPTTFCAGTIMPLTANVVPAGPVVFSPTTDLYTDAAATIPYTGTPVTNVWAKPTVTRTYTATATTAAGCVSSSTITLTVNQLPAITAQPVAAAAPICPGFNATYTVTATGTGLTYQWQVSTDGGVTYTNLLNNPPYSGVTTNALTVTNVTTAMNNYRYRVIVSGTCAPPATSNAVTLVVATAPTITSNPANVTICAGANASFTVAATGVPAPTIYQWQVSTDGGVTWTNLTTGGSFTPTYTITGATTAVNNTRYRAIVTNSCGQTVTSGVALLTVNALPVVSVTSLTGTRICISDTLVPLSGLPVGGSWSGIGVSGFNFVPAVTAVGTFTLTYTYTNAAGCTAAATTIAKVEDCPERIRLMRDNGVLLYPNPNNGQFFVKVNSTLYNYLGIRVYNAAGQVVNGTISSGAVASPTYSGLVYGRVIPINLSNLPNGTYLVKVYYDDGIRTAEKAFPVVIMK